MAKFIFDWANKTIWLNTAEISSTVNNLWQTVYSVNVIDIYSEWKIWATQSDNLKYEPAFATIWWEPISSSVNVWSYFFMRTDYWWVWIPPEEDDIIINMSWNLYPINPDDWVFKKNPTYTSVISLITSSLTQTISTWSWLSTAEHDKLFGLNTTNLDVPVSTRADQTSVDDIKTDTSNNNTLSQKILKFVKLIFFTK